MSEQKERFVKGRSWGNYSLSDNKLEFTGDGKQWFDIPLSAIANVQHVPGKNELTLEFNQEEENVGDALCEMRLFIPNKEKEKEKEGEEEEEEEEEEGSAVKNVPKTSAHVLKDEIIKIGNIGTVSGSIAHVPEVQMITPRGKFDLYFMENFLKIHGQSHNYKILNKNIIKVFLVPKTDGHNHYLILKLKSPLSQGNTTYPFLVIQLKSDSELSIDINIPENSAIKSLENPLSGKSIDVLAKLFVHVVGVGIILPSKTYNFMMGPFIKCAYKVNEGILYPLEKGLLFVHKPVLHISHDDIKEVTCSRMQTGGLTQKMFDMTVTTKKDLQFIFVNIEKDEGPLLESYFKAKKIKFTAVDESGENVEMGVYSSRRRAKVTEDVPELPSEEELGDDDYSVEESGEDESEEESKEKKKKKEKREKGSGKKGKKESESEGDEEDENEDEE